ncbi:unnamed protein product [Prorocentrum cordatum]|uniref:Uncharacterized protein n=1 Tax=Prorocentrum cordatum TaxID=2364126 RepID=A0ABN9T9R5_9DINO|nr:unnamed protein product [Polarella glacialis]
MPSARRHAAPRCLASRRRRGGGGAVSAAGREDVGDVGGAPTGASGRGDGTAQGRDGGEGVDSHVRGVQGRGARRCDELELTEEVRSGLRQKLAEDGPASAADPWRTPNAVAPCHGGQKAAPPSRSTASLGAGRAAGAKDSSPASTTGGRCLN